ncbi:ATP-dependent RNA helicase [Vibrio sp. S9_S30]|uniref:helicase-related protein n=1 Tax=Vibrio sp. S9_S30 TaxID=2720226 RepID=UPI0016804186|nr:helicase-related protein [Vibrio sp. S9_S30]MBD1556586.1 ATP-dependent RNA helicase [Vibrio sp. S9_S30]
MLPIDAIKPEFDSLISQHHLVVEAETGSGKSTRLPLWAAQYGRVLVVEPRRIACTSLAEYLAKEDRTKLGDKIGYAIKLHSFYSDNTQVVFVTPGVALRWYSENKLSNFDTVMVDEFHERRWDTDLLVSILRREDQHRLIVTSATLESQRLVDYIGGKRLYAEGRVYSVSVGYRATDTRHLPDIRGLEQKVRTEVEHCLHETEGDILVFLPGRKEITQCQQSLSSLDNVLVTPLHASVSDAQRELALQQQRQQKVVLATNVAETSLTIPNISVVIDSGLERRTMQRNGRTVLSLKHISKASAKQRAGRAGRVQDGVCVRLFGEHAPLDAVTPPELHREALTEAMLASASCGYPLASLTFLDPLPEKSVAQAIERLTQMGAIDEQGAITPHGEILYPLPIDALYADLLTRLPTKPLREAMVDLSAALCTPARLFKLPESEDKLEKLNQWEPKGCDALTLIKLIRGEPCDVLSVDAQVLGEAQALARQMRDALSLPDLDVASRFDSNALVNEIAQLHPELVFVRREKRRQALGNGYSELTVGRDSRFPDKADAAVVLDQHSLPGRGVKQTLNLATMMMPMAMNQIEALGIGEWIDGESLEKAGEWLTRSQYVYAGRVIAERLNEPQGVKSVVNALLQDKAWKGFAETLKADIAAWNLYQALQKVHTEGRVENAECWLEQQLHDLGVETLADLDVLEPEDIQFEGIPYWERAEFDEKFPTLLNIGDLQLTVEYFPSKKLVHVVYLRGLRKGDPKRWELPRWSGWRVQYRKASRIVDIKN